MVLQGQRVLRVIKVLPASQVLLDHREVRVLPVQQGPKVRLGSTESQVQQDLLDLLDLRAIRVLPVSLAPQALKDRPVT